MSEGDPAALDGDRLLAYLRTTWHNPKLTWAEPPARLRGGLETLTWSLDLEGPNAPDLLVLRMLKETEGERARLEGAFQSGVADAGFPAPRAVLVCDDPSVLGAPFVLMERLPGVPMVARMHRPTRLGRLMGEAHARLHALPTCTIENSLMTAGLATPSLDDRLENYARRIVRVELPGASEGMRWLLDRRPSEPARHSVFHGDFNPQNILITRSQITGVVDWAGINVMLADPACDHGATMTMLTGVRLPWALRPFLRRFARAYRAAYEANSALDPEVVTYYRLLRCLEVVVVIAEQRRGLWGIPREQRDRQAFDWDRPGSLDGFIAPFRGATGIELKEG